MDKYKQTVSSIYVCTLCATKCANKSNINRHMKKIHGVESKLRKPCLQCPLCRSDIGNFELLDRHLLSNHQIECKYKHLKFDCKRTFEEWKLDFEKKTKSFFRFYNSKKDNKTDAMMTKFICHRSGIYTTQQKTLKRQREMKVKGTNKMGCHCPARIIMKEDKNEVKVEVMETHVGHEAEVGTLRLTKSERATIAEKLFQGIPNRRILEDIGKTFNADDRFSYTTNHDIHNIKNAFNVQSNVIFHSDDASSVNILIKKLQDSYETPILYYKPYGLENQEIGEENFFLLFMNAAQQNMLEKYGDNILMIDSTHGTNPYQIQLTTLMVVDADYEGFPVALLWSKLQTEVIYRKFFACLKEKVPNLKPKIFISDDTNIFYNAFTKEYQNYPEKLLCDWHVKRNLFDNLRKINVVEKRKKVKKDIKNLIDELDENTFDRILQHTVQILVTDPDTKKYGEYFQKYYSCRPTQWAHCFRKGFRKNTNMSLEKWHQELKYNSTMGGKRPQRLDASIANVIECLRQKFLRRLTSLCRNRVPHKLSELRRRHNISEQIVNDTDIFEEVPNVKWLVASTKNISSTQLLHFYAVSYENNSNDICKCNFKCISCNACIHMFACDCQDYSIQFNMCKHIHLVCQKYPRERTSSVIITKDKNSDQEHTFISNHLEEQINSKDVELRKRSIREKIDTLISVVDKCDNDKAISHIEDNIKTLLSSIEVLSSKQNSIEREERNPPNKHIERQVRSFEKGKKRKKLKTGYVSETQFFDTSMQ